MKSRFLILSLTVFVFACKAKDPVLELQDDLKNSMRTYLYNGINNDSSNVKYYVEKVNYYDDNYKKKYICEFTVRMKTKLFDTTGIMKAYISRDFKTVERLY
jgi:hypothetical protein